MGEYRVWITVPDLPFSADDVWEPLIDELERRHGDLGPVLSWDGADMTVVLATDSDSEARAAQTGIDAVAGALHRAGLGSRYPASVEVELVEEHELEPA